MTDEAGADPPTPTSLAPMEEDFRSAIGKLLGPYMDQQIEGLARIATLLSVSLMILAHRSLPVLTNERKQDVA